MSNREVNPHWNNLFNCSSLCLFHVIFRHRSFDLEELLDASFFLNVHLYNDSILVVFISFRDYVFRYNALPSTAQLKSMSQALVPSSNHYCFREPELPSTL